MQVSQQVEVINPQTSVDSSVLAVNSNQKNSHKLTSLTEKKSYISIAGCVYEYIITSSLSSSEKLYYFIVDTSSIIKLNYDSKRVAALCAKTWATKLGCSRPKIFALQKSLEQKEYFDILREKNKLGQNKRNLITPTIPDKDMPALHKASNKYKLSNLDTLNLAKTSEHSEFKRLILDKSKLFIKLNYFLFKSIVADSRLSSLEKIIWLDFYMSCYKKHIHSKGQELTFFASYKELMARYSCAKPTLSKALNKLYKLGFIQREHLLIKNCMNNPEEQNINDNSFGDNLNDRKDHSLWKFAISWNFENLNLEQDNSLENSEKEYKENVILAKYDNLENSSNITYKKSSNFVQEQPFIPNISSFFSVSFSDSPVSNSLLYINKIPLIKNSLDNIDTKTQESEIFEKDNPVENESCLFSSEFFKNEIQENIEEPKARIVTSEYIQKLPVIPQAEQKEQAKQEQQRNTQRKEGKELKHYYPLSESDVSLLNSKSGREFSVNFVNQLLLKLYIKYPDRRFISKNHMFSYMSKALANELHQSPKVNCESFRFPINIDEQEKNLLKQEKYLAEIEDSKATDRLTQLKKKIAGVFDSTTAYLILNHLKVVFTENKDTNRSANDLLRISLTMQEKLTPLQEEILKNQAKAVYQRRTIYGEVELEMEVKMNYKRQVVSWTTDTTLSSNTVKSKESEKQQKARYIATIDQNTIWGKIRRELINYYDERGKEGIALDKAWFSKLKEEEGEEESLEELKLQAPSKFMGAWINQNYGHNIREISSGYGLKFYEINTPNGQGY